MTCCKSGHSVTFYSPNTNNGVDCRGPIQQINTGDCFRATRKLRNYRFRTSGSYYRVGETRNLDEGSLLNHGRRRWTCMAFSDQSSVQMPRGKSLYQVMTGTRLHWWHLLGLFKQKQKKWIRAQEDSKISLEIEQLLILLESTNLLPPLLFLTVNPLAITLPTTTTAITLAN